MSMCVNVDCNISRSQKSTHLKKQGKLEQQAKTSHPVWSLKKIHDIVVPGGVLGYKRDGGGPTEPNILHPKKYMDLILCTQKNTRLEILDPKKYMTFMP